MRTLKKTLCLLLALVMMLGLCAVSASATSFTDDAQIEEDYREAIEVLAAIGVYQGVGDGSLAPKEQLTRVQGCYLICKMLKVPNGAGFASFSDVSAADSGVVAYCQTLGLVHGYGDNTFHPTEPLTGAAFAKWCLVALGYNCDVEGIMGDNWLVPNLQLSTSAGLTDGLTGYDQTASMTREQAGQMLLNMLKARMVEYQGGASVTGDNLSVNITGTRVYVPSTADEDYRLSFNTGFGNSSMDNTSRSTGYGDGYVQFAETYFPLLKMNDLNNNAAATDMYTPLKHSWTYAGVEIYRVLDTPVAYFNGKMKASEISAQLANYYIKGGASTSSSTMGGTNYYINNAGTPIDNGVAGTFNLNVQVNGTTAAVGAGSSDSAATATARTGRIIITNSTNGQGTVIRNMSVAQVIADLTANGREVALYAKYASAPNQISDIVITNYTVAKVDDITVSGSTTRFYFKAKETSSDTETLTDIVYREVYSDAPSDSRLLCDTALAKGDYVTLTYAGSDNEWNKGTTTLYAYATNPVNGTQTHYSSNNTVIVDGTTYNIGTGVHKNTGSGKLGFRDFNTNAAGTFYFDQFGYLVHSNTKPTPKYAFIVNATGSVSTSYDGDTPSVKVLAVLSDGTYGEYNVKVQKYSDINRTVKHPESVKYPVVNEDGFAAYDVDEAYSPSNNDWFIANTNILLLKGGGDPNDEDGQYIDNSTSTSGTTTGDAAKILMSDAYGYVYEYTLSGDTLTLTPLTDDIRGEGDTAYNFDPDTNTLYKPDSGDQVYAGQTHGAIRKNLSNYTATDAAVGLYTSGDGTDYDRNYTSQPGVVATPGKVLPTNRTVNTDLVAAGAQSSGLSVVVDRDTPIVIFDSKAKTSATIVTGISTMPTLSSDSAIGYFAGKIDSSGTKITTDVIFITRDNGINTETREYIYVNPKGYTDEKLSNGDTIYHYDAWHENGEKFEVIRDGDLGGAWTATSEGNRQMAGLYLANSNNYLTSYLLGKSSVANKDDINSSAPYDFAIASVKGNVVDVNGTAYYLTDSTVKVFTESSNPDVIDGNPVFVVLETSEGSVTRNIKTIYVMDIDNYMDQ